MWVAALAALLTVGAGDSPAAADGPSAFERQASAAEAELGKRRGRPEAVAALAALVALEENLPPGRLDPVLRGLAGDHRTHPLVAAQVEYLLALADARGGDAAAAERRYRALGLIDADAFQVIGPFDAQGRGALAVALPPEQAGGGPGEPARTFPGKEREVSWRRAAGGRRAGALALDALLRPDSDAAAYAVTHVRSDRPRRLVLRLGSAGPVKVWIDGRPVFERNVVRDSRLDQDAVAVALPAGTSALLVKTVITSGAWRLFARFTERDGRVAAGLGFSAQSPGTQASGANAATLVRTGTSVSRPAPAPELGALLAARARAAKGDAASRAWLDHARWLALSRAGDRDAKEIEASLERAAAGSATTEALLLLGERALEEEDRRRALERAAGSEGDARLRALALAGLGEVARGRRRQTSAIDYFHQALAADPGCLPAVLALASEEQLAGLTSAALARLEALPAAVRTTLKVRLARVRILESLGRRTEASAELQAVFALRRTDVDLALDVAREARQRGDLDRAIALHAEVARQRPELGFVAIEWARLLEGKGDRAGAAAVLKATIDRLPDEASLHEEQGRMRLRAGDTPGGIAALRHALELRPQNPGLRRYVSRLAADAAETQGPSADDLARDWTEDTAALARRTLTGADRPRPGEQGAGSVVLLDKQVVRVHRNGLSERFTQRLVQVRTMQAAREALEYYVRYTPGSQEVEIRRARIYRRAPDGERSRPGRRPAATTATCPSPGMACTTTCARTWCSSRGCGRATSSTCTTRWPTSRRRTRWAGTSGTWS